MPGTRGSRRRLFRWTATALAVGVTLAAAGAITWWTRDPMLVVHHAPASYERRVGELSANVCGVAFEHASLRYKINGGSWIDVHQVGSRTRKPAFTVEIESPLLLPGKNELILEASARLRGTHTETILFDYDPAPIELPRTVDWSGPLDVQDGQWEVVAVEGERRVRPRPGTEGYDRLMMVSGAFPAARRVETEVTFRSASPHSTVAGFGVLTMWGGHTDESGRYPQRGWLYSVAWYMKPYGPWCEFSVRRGSSPRADNFAGSNVPDPEPGSRWKIIAECWPEKDAEGLHRGYRQRMKLWPAGTPEPSKWLECDDAGLARLPERDYAVALLAHECQVEFGPVRILPLPAR